MKFTVIVLNWNNASDTLECLSSLEKLSYPSYDILVVDNGSTDDSVARIRAAFPQIPILENGENLGYSAGNNRGIEVALEKGADFILLLNNDTVVAPNLLQAFAEAAITHPRAGAFGAKIFFYDEPATLWYGGGDVDLPTLRCFHRGCGASDSDKQFETIAPTNYACGCAIALRSKTLREVGLFSPDFFLLWEEIDWCWRMRRAGWECLFVPKARVWHKVSASFPEGNRGPFWQYHYFRSRLLFLKRNYSFKERLPFYLKRFPRELLGLVAASLNPRTPKDLKNEYRAALKGTFSYFIE